MEYILMIAIQVAMTTASVVVVNRKLMFHNIALTIQKDPRAGI